MPTLSLVVLILGVLLIVVSGVLLFFLYASRFLHDAEIEGMKRNGKFEGEPDFMRDFRVARAEFDLEANQQWTRRLWLTLPVGFCLVSLSFVLWFVL